MSGRQYLTQKQWNALLEAQGGVCCVAGCNVSEGLEAEHSTPNAIRAGRPDQLMCQPHHREKTKRDVKEIARAKRLSGEKMSQYEKRKRFGPALRSRNTFENRRGMK